MDATLGLQTADVCELCRRLHSAAQRLIYPKKTVALGNRGEISNVIDDRGGPTAIEPRVTPKVAQFPNQKIRSTSAAVLAILGQSLRRRLKPLSWSFMVKRDFGWDPLVDHNGNRMKWIRRIAPNAAQSSL